MIKTGMILSALVFTIPSAWADGIPIEPGLWEVTSTMNMPLMPEPRVTTMMECMESSEISITDMGGGEADSNCTFDSALVDGNTMKWSADCPIEGGTSHGDWTATSMGDAVTGEGVVTMNVNGKSMNLTMSWEGRRIGDCSPSP